MTIFDSHEQKAYDQATKLQLTQAIIVSVDEERHGQYQCRVLPDLLNLEDETGCPWYPLLNKHEKLDTKPGDLVWLYVSEDLGVGYVWCKTNTVADMSEKQAVLWDDLSKALSETTEASVDTTLDYDSTFYTELFSGTFLFFDREKGVVGFSNGTATVMVQEGKLFIEGDITQQGDLARVGDETRDGSSELTGSLKVGEGSSPAARSNDVVEALGEIEQHIHVSPVGPVGPPVDPSMAPLSVQLAMIKQTIGSTNVTLD